MDIDDYIEPQILFFFLLSLVVVIFPSKWYQSYGKIMGKIILKMMLDLNYDMRPFDGIIISIFDKVPSKVF